MHSILKYPFQLAFSGNPVDSMKLMAGIGMSSFFTFSLFYVVKDTHKYLTFENRWFRLSVWILWVVLILLFLAGMLVSEDLFCQPEYEEFI